MTDTLDTKIREALEAQAQQIEVPEDLARRTMAAVGQKGKLGLRARLRAARDTRRRRVRVTGHPRWAYAAGAAAAAVMLFALGTLVTTEGGLDLARPQTAERTSSDAEAAIEAGQSSEDGLRLPSLRRGDEDGSAPAAQELRGVDEPAGPAELDRGIPPVEPGPPAPGGTVLPPRLVRTAEIFVQVDDFDRAWSAANRVAASHDGFVTSSSTSQMEGRLASGWVQMRVPAERLDAALADLRELGTLTRLETNARDIADQIVDVEARIRAAEATELQLLELLRRANTVSETLEVRSRLDATRQQIERLRAQQQAFSDQVEFAAVSAQIFEEGAEPGRGNGGIIRDAWETALRVGLTIVAGTVVVLGGLVPLAALALGVWLLVRLVRSRGRPAGPGQPADEA